MIMRQKARHSRGRRSGTRCCGGTDEIRSIVVMGQGAQDLRTPDYYFTTVLKDTKNLGAVALQWLPGLLRFSSIFVQNY